MVLEIRFKKLHSDAIIPSYAHPGDAGLDVTATSKTYDEHGNVVYGTGLTMELPENYVCLIFPRSSNCKKHLILSNCVGVFDSTYRGELFFKFKPSEVFIPVYENNIQVNPLIVFPTPVTYNIGDRIGQLLIIPYPTVKPIEADELSDSIRGIGGWGSTGV